MHRAHRAVIFAIAQLSCTSLCAVGQTATSTTVKSVTARTQTDAASVMTDSFSLHWIRATVRSKLLIMFF